MKETIYTIPLSDAFGEPCECPFCKLEKQLETEGVEYALGASMMEPDSRMISNEKGFCRRHFEQMKGQQKALSLALVLDTHVQEVIGKIEKNADNIESAKGLFKKKSPIVENLIQELDKLEGSCAICDKLNDTLEKFACVFWYLYKTEPVFKQKVMDCQGFCLVHFRMLLSTASKELSGEKLDVAVKELIEIEIKNLKRISEDINWFTKKFDYRYQDEPWKTSKDAIPRTIEKLVKFL